MLSSAQSNLSHKDYYITIHHTKLFKKLKISSASPQIQFFSDVVRLINCYIIIIITTTLWSRDIHHAALQISR